MDVWTTIKVLYNRCVSIRQIAKQLKINVVCDFQKNILPRFCINIKENSEFIILHSLQTTNLYESDGFFKPYPLSTYLLCTYFCGHGDKFA